MKIFVKGLDGRTVVIYVESSSDTVDSVKAKLEDGHKLSDYNVHELATMCLLSCHRSPSCSDSMCIYVQKRTSKTMVLQVGPSDTITHVRKKISGHQSLFLAGSKLEDDRTYLDTIMKSSKTTLPGTRLRHADFREDAQ